MKSFPMLLGMGMALLVPSMEASAQTTVSYEVGSRTAFSPTELNFSDSLSFFDSNLGTLTGATLTLFDAMETTFYASNNASTTQIFGVTGTSDYYWSSSNSTVDALIASNPGSIALSSGIQTLGAGASMVIGPLSGEEEIVIDLSSYLSEFQTAGGGSFDLNLQTSTGTGVVGGGGNVSVGQVTTGAVQAKITYTYSPVPEPSVAMLGLVAGVAGLVRRRR